MCKEISIVSIILLILIGVFVYNCATHNESFYIPPSVVSGGDFHIQAPGAIADQGSFTDDMRDYIYGEGQGDF